MAIGSRGTRQNLPARRQEQRQQLALQELHKLNEVGQLTQDPDLIEALEVLELTEAAVRDGNPEAIAEVLRGAKQKTSGRGDTRTRELAGRVPGWGELTPEKTGTADLLSQVAGVADIAALIAEAPRIINWTLKRAPAVLRKATPAVAGWAARKAGVAGAGAVAGSFVAPGPGTAAVGGAALLGSLGYDVYKLAKWVRAAKKADPAKTRYLAETATRNAQRISRRFGTPAEVTGGVLHTAAGAMSGDPWELGLGVAQTGLAGGPAVVRGARRLFQQAPPTGAAPTAASDLAEGRRLAGVEHPPQGEWLQANADALVARAKTLGIDEALTREAIARAAAESSSQGRHHQALKKMVSLSESQAARRPAAGVAEITEPPFKAGDPITPARPLEEDPIPGEYGTEAYYRNLDERAEAARDASADFHYEVQQYESELRAKFPNIPEAQLQTNVEAYRLGDQRAIDFRERLDLDPADRAAFDAAIRGRDELAVFENDLREAFPNISPEQFERNRAAFRAGDQKALDFSESLRKQREARQATTAAKPRTPSKRVPKPAWFPKGTTKAGKEFKKHYMVDSGLNAKEAAADLRKISQGKADQALVDKVKETYDVAKEQRTPEGIRIIEPGAREGITGTTHQLEPVFGPNPSQEVGSAGQRLPKNILIDDPSGEIDIATGKVRKISVPNPQLEETAEAAARRSAQAQEGLAARAAEDAAIEQGEIVTPASSELSGTRTAGGPQALPRQSPMGPEIGAKGAYADWVGSISKDDEIAWAQHMRERGYSDAEFERFRQAAFNMHASKTGDPGLFAKRWRDFTDAQEKFLRTGEISKQAVKGAEAGKDPSAIYLRASKALKADPEKFQRVMLQTRQRMERIMQNIRVQTEEMAGREGATRMFMSPTAYEGLPRAYDPLSQSRILDEFFALGDQVVGDKPFKDPMANLLFRMTFIAEEVADQRIRMRMLSGVDPELVKRFGYNPTRFTEPGPSGPAGGLNEPLTYIDPKTGKDTYARSLANVGNQIQRTVEDMVGLRMKLTLHRPGFPINAPRVIGIADEGTTAASKGPYTVPTREARSFDAPGAKKPGDPILSEYGYIEPAPRTTRDPLTPTTVEELEQEADRIVGHYAKLLEFSDDINAGKMTMFAGLDPTLLTKFGMAPVRLGVGGTYGFQRGEEFGRESGYGPAGQRGAGLVGMGIGAAGGYAVGPAFKGVWKRGAPLAINLQNALRFNLLSGPTSVSKAAIGAHSGGFGTGFERMLTGLLKQTSALRARMGGASKAEVAPLMEEAVALRNSGARIIRDMAKLEYDFFTKGDELIKQTYHIDVSTKEGAADFKRLMQEAGIDESMKEYISLERMGGALTENWLGRAFRAADFPVLTTLIKNGVDFNTARQATLTGRFRTKVGEDIFNFIGGNQTQLKQAELAALRQAPKTSDNLQRMRKLRDELKKGHLPWIDLATTAAAPIVRVGAHGAEQALRHTIAPAARLAGSNAPWLKNLAPADDAAGNLVRLGMGVGGAGAGIGVGAYGNPRLETMATAAAGPLMVPMAAGIGIGRALREGRSPLEAGLTTAGSTWEAISPFSPEIATTEGFPGTVGRYASPNLFRQIWGGLDRHRRSTAQTDIQRGVAEGTISPNVAPYLSRVTAPLIQATPYGDILPRRSPAGTIDSVSGMSAAPRYINLNPASENFAFNRPWLDEGFWGQPGMGGAEASEARLRELRGPDISNLPPTEGRHSKFDHPVGQRSALFDKLPEAVRGGTELVRNVLDKAFFPPTPHSRVVGAGVNEAAQLLATSGYLDEEGRQVPGVSLGSPESRPPSGTMTTTAQPHVNAPHPLGTSAPVGGMTPRTEELVRVTRGRKNAQVQQMLDRVRREDPAYFNMLKTNPAQFRYWLEWADKRAEHYLQPWSEADLLNEVRRQGATVPQR